MFLAIQENKDNPIKYLEISLFSKSLPSKFSIIVFNEDCEKISPPDCSLTKVSKYLNRLGDLMLVFDVLLVLANLV